MQLQPYFDNFGQDAVMPVFFERLIDKPQQELERVCQFLGYPQKALWHQDVAAQNVSSARMQTSKWRDFLVEAPVLSTLRKTFVPKSFRERVRTLWTMQEKPQLSAGNLDYLRIIFDEDLKVLGGWLGLETLSCETFKAIVKTHDVTNKFIW